jgi:hypothetical protein
MASGPFTPPSYVVVVIVTVPRSQWLGDLACGVVVLPFIGDATTCSDGVIGQSCCRLWPWLSSPSIWLLIKKYTYDFKKNIPNGPDDASSIVWAVYTTLLVRHRRHCHRPTSDLATWRGVVVLPFIGDATRTTCSGGVVGRSSCCRSWPWLSSPSISCRKYTILDMIVN